MTKKSGITHDVLQQILNHSMTGMSFEEIQLSLCQRRKSEYLTRRLEYDISRNLYCTIHNLNITSVPSFGAMDDISGYNDLVASPTANYIIDCYKDYVKKYEEKMLISSLDIPPFPVVSADHTFNTSDRRTKEFVPGLEPEYVPSGSSLAGHYQTIESSSALLIVMGANGQVYLMNRN